MATTSPQQAAVNPVAAAPNTPIAVPPVAQAPLVPPPTRPQVSASLYIGDLDPEIGESVLYDLFKEIGNVASIRVCRDAITRVSLGYAYVNFHNVDSAERAIAVLNGTVLNKRPCRIMWSRRDPSIRKSGVGNIFIKNLSPDVDHAGLYDLFSTFGNIYSCKLVTGKNGQSKGYGFVHYQSKESADTAIAKMNNLRLNGKEVYVAPFIPKRDRPQKNPEDIFTNVFIKNIPESVTEEKFNSHFSQFGKITSAKLAVDEEGKSKGFGFVNFASHEEALACVNTVNNTELNGKILYAARAQSKAERAEQLKKKREEQANKYHGVNLYIKNIDDSVDEEKLRKPFSEFGAITSIKIMATEKGQSKGFGFVCYSKPEEATKALTKMNNFMFEGKPLYVALAQRKEQRRAQLEAQHAQRNNLAARMGQPGQIGMNPPMGYPPMFYPQVPANQSRPFMYPGQVGQPFPRNTRPYTAGAQGPGGFQAQPSLYPNPGGQPVNRGRGNNQQRVPGGPRGVPPGGPRVPPGGGVPQPIPAGAQQPPRKVQPAAKAPGEQEDSTAATDVIYEHLLKNYTGAIAEQVLSKLATLGEQELLDLSKDSARLDARVNEIVQEL